MTHVIAIICRTPHVFSTQSIFSDMQISFPNFTFLNTLK